MLTTVQKERFLVVKVNAEKIDSEVAAAFRSELAEAVANKSSMVLLDLSDVIFIDSSGLAAIVYCFNMTRIRKELVICGVNEKVRHLFHITKIDDLVRIYDSADDAVSSLEKAG